MTHKVLIVADAEDDVFDIYRYIALNDSPTKADYALGKLRDACESLSTSPERGHFPPELERIGVSDYREIHFKPYRIIYQISRRQVFVHVILDGRRDLQDLLERRQLHFAGTAAELANRRHSLPLP
jgi:toxin ParE1/3/4